MAAQLAQFEPAARQPQRAGDDAAVRQQRLGALHPVAAGTVEIALVGARLRAHALQGGGGRRARHVGEGLVAEKVVGMQVQVQDLRHGHGRRAGDQRTQLLAVAPARAGVDDQHAIASDDEAGVDDVAAIGTREVGMGALHDVDTRREGACGEPVVERGGIGARLRRGRCRLPGLSARYVPRGLRDLRALHVLRDLHVMRRMHRCRTRARHGGERQRAGQRGPRPPSAAHSRPSTRLPLLSTPTTRIGPLGRWRKSNENTGFSLTSSQMVSRSSSAPPPSCTASCRR